MLAARPAIPAPMIAMSIIMGSGSVRQEEGGGKVDVEVWKCGGCGGAGCGAGIGVGGMAGAGDGRWIWLVYGCDTGILIYIVVCVQDRLLACILLIHVL